MIVSPSSRLALRSDLYPHHSTNQTPSFSINRFGYSLKFPPLGISLASPGFSPIVFLSPSGRKDLSSYRLKIVSPPGRLTEGISGHITLV